MPGPSPVRRFLRGKLDATTVATALSLVDERMQFSTEINRRVAMFFLRGSPCLRVCCAAAPRRLPHCLIRIELIVVGRVERSATTPAFRAGGADGGFHPPYELASRRPVSDSP